MEYNLTRHGEGATVALAGQLNFACNEAFADLLRDLGGIGRGEVAFDLSRLSHIDSVGLGLLYVAREQLAGGGASMFLLSPRGGVKRLLELTEAGDTFDIRD